MQYTYMVSKTLANRKCIPKVDWNNIGCSTIKGGSLKSDYWFEIYSLTRVQTVTCRDLRPPDAMQET